jgi:hypothetical protein
MLTRHLDLYWRAVLVAALAYYLLGAAWGASPIGAAYYRALGFAPSEGWVPGPAMYLVPLLGCLAASVATAVLARATNARTVGDGLTLGALVGFGYSAVVAGMDAVAPHNALPGTLFGILGGYHLVSLALVGAIVTAWRPRPAAAGAARASPASS